MVVCAAYGCSSTSGRDKVGFFRFPRDAKRKKIWVTRLRRGQVGSSLKPYIVTEHLKLCSLHFEKDQFDAKNPDFARSIGYAHKKSLLNFSGRKTDNYDKCFHGDHSYTLSKEERLETETLTNISKDCSYSLVKLEGKRVETSRLETPSTSNSDTGIAVKLKEVESNKAAIDQVSADTAITVKTEPLDPSDCASASFSTSSHLVSVKTEPVETEPEGKEMPGDSGPLTEFPRNGVLQRLHIEQEWDHVLELENPKVVIEVKEEQNLAQMYWAAEEEEEEVEKEEQISVPTETTVKILEEKKMSPAGYICMQYCWENGQKVLKRTLNCGFSSSSQTTNDATQTYEIATQTNTRNVTPKWCDLTGLKMAEDVQVSPKKKKKKGPSGCFLFYEENRLKVMMEILGNGYVSHKFNESDCLKISKRLGEMWLSLPGKEKWEWKQKAQREARDQQADVCK